jgi:maltose/moltooligosaccharide transporter
LGGLAMLISGLMQKNNTDNGFVTIMNDFQFIKIMKQFGFNSFLVCAFHVDLHRPSRLQHIYGTTDTTSEAYNTGANQVGEMFANYNLIAAIVFFLLPLLAKYTSRKFTHFVALVCGGLGLMSVYFITEPTVFTMEWLPMVGVGIAWASILSYLRHVIRLTAI